MGEKEDYFMPIKALNQFSPEFTIKARIVKKHELRHYINARGEGDILNLDLIDREGTMIQATAFGQVALDFNNRIKQNKVYILSNG